MEKEPMPEENKPEEDKRLQAILDAAARQPAINSETKEVFIVALMLAAALGVFALGGRELASMLGGAACALVVPRAGTATRALIVAGGVGLATLAPGCGAHVSQELRTAYAAEVMRCHANERAIVEREPEETTIERDENDLAAERQRCNDALRRIETTDDETTTEHPAEGTHDEA